METWRAVMSKGMYPYADSAPSKASRYGVLDDESDKLQQPLISRHDDAPYGYDSDRAPEDDDYMEQGGYVAPPRESDRLLHKHRHGGERQYEEISLKPSSTAVLKSLVSNVLWPMTAIGAQTAKVYEPRSVRSYQVEDQHTLHSVPTLRSMTKSRRRSDTVDDVHERALVRIALVTVFFSLWLIITVYRNAD